MKVSIIGGGIGGLTAALALRRKGINAEVFEAAPHYDNIGKGIWIPPNAMQILQKLGIASHVIGAGVPLNKFEIHDSASGLLQPVDLNHIESRFGYTTVSILRSSLHGVLAQALPDGIIRHDKRCDRVRQTNTHCEATFVDGSSVESDLIVGADGLRSAVRASLFPEATLRHSGQACYLGISTTDIKDIARQSREIWGGRFRFGFSPVSDNLAYWFAPFSSQETQPAQHISHDDLDRILDNYSEFPDPVQQIIRSTRPEDVTLVNINELPPLKRWTRGRVTLLGDAAHAMTPNLGQGGAQSIEDAFFLARCLYQEESIPAAIKAYENMRRPRTARISNTARQLGRMAHMQSRMGRTVRNALLRNVPRSMSHRRFRDLYTIDTADA